MEEVNVRYVSSPAEFGSPDAVILPGSKNTIQDLLWMRQNGLEAKILRHASSGGLVFGICGGYQMLGEEVADPFGAEQKGAVRGMGLLPVRTVFSEEKTRTRVEGRFLNPGGILQELKGTAFEGYEIHMGESVLLESAGAGRTGSRALVEFSALQEPGRKVHGIFDAPGCAKGFVSALLKEKGYDPSRIKVTDWKAYKEEQYDKLADIIRASLDMKRIYQIIETGK